MDKLGQDGGRRTSRPSRAIPDNRLLHRPLAPDSRGSTPARHRTSWITPASSKVTRVRRFSWTMRVPRTHWARSLSGVQMMTRSTRASRAAAGRSRSERVVRFKLNHGPDDNASRREDVFEQWELRQQVGFDAFAGLVAWPQFVAERFDDVIGRNGDVRGAAFDHAQNRCEHASDRGDLLTIPIPRGRQRVVVPEQLVCAVDEIDFQRAAPTPRYRTAAVSIN